MSTNMFTLLFRKRDIFRYIYLSARFLLIHVVSKNTNKENMSAKYVCKSDRKSGNDNNSDNVARLKRIFF